MRKVLFAAICLLLATSSAWANRGAWENLSADPNAAASGFMSVSAVDENTLFSVGVEQTSNYGAAYAWRSLDGGQTMTPIYTFDGGSGNSCDLVNFFQFMVAGDWLDKDHGLTVGMAIPASCVQQHPNFPDCLFECMFAIKPYVWTVTNGGDTFTQHDVNGSLTKMLMTAKIVGQTIYACGTGGLFEKSTDFGATWVALPPPETGFNTEMDAMWWIDESIGYIGSAAPAQKDALGASAPTSVAEALAWFDALRAPFAQVNFDKEPPGDGAKVSEGNLYKTIDGGHTWTKIYDSGNKYSVLKVQMLDEMNGLIVTSEWGGSKAEETIMFTHDGGATWTKSAIPDVGPDNSKYIISDIRMLTPSLGYAGGAYQAGLAAKTIMLATTDGGAHWAFDTIGAAPNYAASPDGYGVTAMGFADNRRGFGVGMNLSVIRYDGQNAAPTANAGPNQTVAIGETVKLDGSKSSDPDGDLLLYFWSETDGPATVTFSNAYVDKPTFVAATAGEYHIQLKVSDIEYDATATVTITAVGPADDDAVDDDATDDDDDFSPATHAGGAKTGGCGC